MLTEVVFEVCMVITCEVYPPGSAKQIASNQITRLTQQAIFFDRPCRICFNTIAIAM